MLLSPFYRVSELSNDGLSIIYVFDIVMSTDDWAKRQMAILTISPSIYIHLIFEIDNASHKKSYIWIVFRIPKIIT